MIKQAFIILFLAIQCNFSLYGQDDIYELNAKKPNSMLGIQSEFGILMFSKIDLPNAYEYFQKYNYYYKNELSDSQRENFNQAIQDLLDVTRSQTFSLDFLLSNKTDNQKETFQRIFIENIGIFLIRRGMCYFHDEKGKSKIDKIYSETPETQGLGIGVEYKFYLESKKKRLVFKSFAREIRMVEIGDD